MVESKGNLPCRRLHGNRDCGEPGVDRSEPGRHEVEAVLHVDGHPGAGDCAARSQVRGDPRRLEVEFAVGHCELRALRFDDARAPRVVPRPSVHKEPNVRVHPREPSTASGVDGESARVRIRLMSIAKAIRIREPGGPDVLELGDIEVPNPSPTQVSVEVAAAGLNRADCLQRRGFYPAPPGVPPDVPGLEFAGIIDSVGAAVAPWKPGDRVMGIVGGGAMATRVVTEAAELMAVPEGMSLDEAAAVPEAFLTAYDAVVLQGGLSEGKSVLLHAVASGVGTAAIQLAAVIGAVSIGTSRSAHKLPRCTELGLGHAILVEDGAFASDVKSVAPNGVDVVLDTIGAAYLKQNIQVIARKGRIVVIGLMGGVKGELDLGQLLAKRASIHGSVLRSRSPEEKAELTGRFSNEMLAHFTTGALRPIIDATLPMKDIQSAHARMDGNETFGKLVLTW